MKTRNIDSLKVLVLCAIVWGRLTACTQRTPGPTVTAAPLPVRTLLDLKEWRLVSGDIPLEEIAQVFETSLARVEVTTDSGQIWTDTGNAPTFALIWRTPTAPNGRRRVGCRAVDRAGNRWPWYLAAVQVQN